MKLKTWLLIPSVVILAIALTSYFFFLPKAYRNDCQKDLKNFNFMFAYAYGCSHCKAELLKIEKFNISEEFYMIDVNSKACEEIIKQYSDYLINHKNSNLPQKTGLLVPVKICLRDNKTYVGEMREEDFLEFYENCTGRKL